MPRTNAGDHVQPQAVEQFIVRFVRRVHGEHSCQRSAAEQTYREHAARVPRNPTTREAACHHKDSQDGYANNSFTAAPPLTILMGRPSGVKSSLPASMCR